MTRDAAADGGTSQPRRGQRVAGVLLAAGAGTRFGRPKALVAFAGQSLVDRGAAMLAQAGCRPVVVVLGAAADEVRATVRLAGADIVVNARWSEGLASSLQAGLVHLQEDESIGAAVLALVDQPLVGADVVRRLVAAWADGATIAAAAYSGAVRNPVLFDRRHWEAVARSATGDAGARRFLRENQGLVTPVECGDVGDPTDVDTPETLARLLEATSS